MKNLLVTTVALAALIATPALAKTTAHRASGTYTGAYAQEYVEPGAAAANGVVVHTPYDVYLGGQYLGADPDPQVRQNLLQNGWDSN